MAGKRGKGRRRPISPKESKEVTTDSDEEIVNELEEEVPSDDNEEKSEVDEQEEEEEDDADEVEFNDADDLMVAINKKLKAKKIVIMLVHSDDKNAVHLKKLFYEEIIPLCGKEVKVYMFYDYSEHKEFGRERPAIIYYTQEAQHAKKPTMKQYFTKDSVHLARHAIKSFIKENVSNSSIEVNSEAEVVHDYQHPMEVFYKPIKHPMTGQVIGEQQWLRFNNPALLQYVRDNTNDAELYSGKEIAFDEVEDLFDKLKKRADVWPFNVLFAHIETETKAARETAQQMISEGKISFPLLKYLFKEGDCVVGVVNREFKVGGRVTSVAANRCDFTLDLESISTDGVKFQRVSHNMEIYRFWGTTSIKDLAVVHIDDTTKAFLANRGKKFMQVGIAPTLQYLTGNLYTAGWWSSRETRAEGRVMVDVRSCQKMNPDFRHNNEYSTEAELDEKELGEDQLWMTWPLIHGFSFITKGWGLVPIEHLSDVEFDERAYERLVLPPAKKRLISAFVKNSGTAFTDIIKGKGAGCIFLLHGPPGTGKTLTAEAIAEHLHRPLYSIAVGELGTKTKDLEENLRNILELASVWNAVVLLDEADIFLEARTTKDIVRNAMVGVFLRLLEYHNGVLFLTTNRVACFDEAFHSRISVALHYSHLDIDARSHIWHNLLEAAELPHTFNNANYGEVEKISLHANKLGEYILNGRQIRTTIRLAQTLAASEGLSAQEVTEEHIQMCVDIAMQFVNDTTKDGATEFGK